jgi:hypothetical protein
MTTMQRVFTKARRRWGVEYPPEPTAYQVEIIPGQSIKIIADGENRTDGNHFENEFRLGDLAEYHSYNLSYYGEIVNIGQKSITIKDNDENHRLDLHEFCWRNIRFNAAVAANSNFNTMQYI